MTTDKTVFQVLSFFDQDFLPQRCDCGEAVTFHVNSLLQHLTYNNSTQGITEYSLGYFIKDRGIGCVGWQVHFRERAVQLSAAHIRRKWFHTEDMDALDKCIRIIFVPILLRVLHSLDFECVKKSLLWLAAGMSITISITALNFLDNVETT